MQLFLFFFEFDLIYICTTDQLNLLLFWILARYFRQIVLPGIIEDRK